MNNVKLFTLMYTLEMATCINYNSKISKLEYIPMTILPSVNDIASRCFLKDVCIYGETHEISTDSYMFNNQVIFINVYELEDAGFYIRDKLNILLNNPNVTIVTNDDIYHYDNDMEIREVWNEAFNAVRFCTFEERINSINEKMIGLQFYDTRHIWIEFMDEPFSPLKPLIVLSISIIVLYRMICF